MFLLTPLLLFSSEISIYPMYCVNSNAITLYTFGFTGIDNEILNLQGKKAAKISTDRLEKILTSNFKSFNDKSGGSVAFVKDCNLLDLVQMDFLKKLSDKFDKISIKSIKIEPSTTIPDDFATYKFKAVDLPSVISPNGSFKASFEINDFGIKNIFFRYSFSATMPVLIAQKNIDRGKALSVFDYQKGEIDFDKFDKNSLKLGSSKLVALTNIKSSQILLNRYFKPLNLVKKGDRLNAVIKESGVSIIASVTALSGGNLGDTIKVRTNDNKILDATISSGKEVIIR